MLKLIKTHALPYFKSISSITPVAQQQLSNNLLSCRNFSSNLFSSNTLLQNKHTENSLSRVLLPAVSQLINVSRNVTKFSLKTGKRKSVRAVLTRFYRLNNGLWIRRWAGCHKHLHKRRDTERQKLERHVVCTRTQCIMFDKMVTDHWKKRRYYIDDPFEPYQVRNNFKWVLPIRKR